MDKLYQQKPTFELFVLAKTLMRFFDPKVKIGKIGFLREVLQTQILKSSYLLF